MEVAYSFGSTTATISTILIALLVFFIAYQWISNRSTNLPPGPWYFFPGKQAHIALTELADRFGSIYRIRFGPVLIAVVVNDLETFRDVFIKEGDNFIDRNIPPLIREIAPIEGSFLFEDGELYKERRRFGMSAFRHFGVGKKSLESRINEEARHLCNILEQQDRTGFNPMSFVTMAVANIICVLSFGRRFDYTDPVFIGLLGRLRENSQAITFTSLANFIPFLYRLPMYKKHRDNVRKTKEFIMDAISDHKQTFDENDMRDIIDMYLDVTRKQKEDGSSIVFKERSIWRSIFDLFGAGSDTTANTLLWGLLFLCYDQSIQVRIQEELDGIIGSERPPTMKDRDSLPYTTATVSEMLRCRPAAPITMRGASQDVHIKGFTIPKGATVFGNIWGVNHNPEHWKDPYVFNPERFLSEDGKTYQSNPALFTFGAGRRICLGKQLAEMELFLLLTNLLQRFTFKFPIDQSNPDMEGILGMGHNPKPFSICITNRE